MLSFFLFVQLRWGINTFSFPSSLFGNWFILDADDPSFNKSQPNFNNDLFRASFRWDKKIKVCNFNVTKKEADRTFKIIYNASINSASFLPNPQITKLGKVYLPISDIHYNDLPNDLCNATLTINNCTFDFFGEHQDHLPFNVTCQNKQPLHFYAFHLKSKNNSPFVNFQFLFFAFVVIFGSITYFYYYHKSIIIKEKEEIWAHQRHLLQKQRYLRAKAEYQQAKAAFEKKTN